MYMEIHVLLMKKCLMLISLQEKVESLKSECDRLRDRARLCEDALQRDSDYKVQVCISYYLP